MITPSARLVLTVLVWYVLAPAHPSAVAQDREATTSFTLDHNRLLIDADIQQSDGQWHPARLWVDTGNPDFIVSAPSVAALGVSAIRVGGVLLDIRGLTPAARLGARQWAAMGADANLPSTVLRRYRVIIDYPRGRFTLAPPSGPAPLGQRAAARVHPETGIVQIDASLGGESLSLALDMGASYSFLSRAVFDRLAARHTDWPRVTGAVGAANMWGLWPEEAEWPLVRVPTIDWGGVELRDVGLTGLPDFFGNGISLGEWYSRKTARKVDGFLGPNAFAGYRVEIDYANSAVYFQRGAATPPPDMDLVGLTLKPDSGGRWVVIGVAKKDGKPVADGLVPGDVLLKVGAVVVTGLTMGRVTDLLRGIPGDTRTLVVDRGGKPIRVEARIRRLL